MWERYSNVSRETERLRCEALKNAFGALGCSIQLVSYKWEIHPCKRLCWGCRKVMFLMKKRTEKYCSKACEGKA